jgi:hypothetical protein
VGAIYARSAKANFLAAAVADLDAAITASTVSNAATAKNEIKN